VKLLQLVSCRGWSSDAYWAARVSRELERRGHTVTLGCRRGTEQAVGERARREGVGRIVTFGFAGGLRPATDVADVRELRAAIAARNTGWRSSPRAWPAAGPSCAPGTSRRPCARTPATAGSTATPPRSWWP
jgi:hypothetical protein